MSYQAVGRPVFYINSLEWLATVSEFDITDHFRTLPVSPSDFSYQEYSLPSGVLHDKYGFVAVLGHELKTYSRGY